MGSSAHQRRSAVEAWLDGYEQRLLVRRPEELAAIRDQISGMSDRQIERLAGWLQARGVLAAAPAATPRRGFGLPSGPALQPEGPLGAMALLGHAATAAFPRTRRAARQSVPAAGGL
jgi:hypothetical protein